MWAIGLALFSLYLQILLPVVQAHAVSRDADDGAFGRIWICTYYGLTLLDDGGNGKPPLQQGGKADCPTCFAYAIGTASLANASEVVLHVPLGTKAESIDFAFTARLSFEVPSGYLTRAPPIPV